LYATGSMRGLIGTAKKTIGAIVSDLTQRNEIDTLRLGMIFYRDRGEAFVTKSIPLTTDLDSAYAILLNMVVDGRGGTPESVNQGLHESVHQMAGSNDQPTCRTIFVVGMVLFLQLDQDATDYVITTPYYEVINESVQVY